MVTDVLLCALDFITWRIQLYISLHIKMCKTTLHNSVHFQSIETSAVCLTMTSATLTKLINNVDVIFHLEPGNVCYHMLVKHV